MTKTRESRKGTPNNFGGAKGPVDAETRRAAERLPVAETIIFSRGDIGVIADALDRAILHAVMTMAADDSCNNDDDTLGAIRCAGQARLLIRDEVERAEEADEVRRRKAEQAAGGAS